MQQNVGSYRHLPTVRTSQSGPCRWRRLSCGGGGEGAMARRAERQRVRTNKMLVAVVAVFALTWTPFHVHSLIAEFRHDLVLGPRPRARSTTTLSSVSTTSCSVSCSVHDLGPRPRALGPRPRARSVLQARRRAVPRLGVQLGLRQPGPLRLDERPLPRRVRRPRHPPSPPCRRRRRRGVPGRRQVGRRASRLHPAERRRRGQVAARRTARGEVARRPVYRVRPTVRRWVASIADSRRT